MKRLILALSIAATLATSSACIPRPPHPGPNPPPTHAALSVVVADAVTSAPIPAALVQLHTGESGLTNTDGYVVFNNLPLGERGINVQAMGYYSAFAEAKPFTENTNVNVFLIKEVPPLQRVMACGKNFCTQDGARWHWRGISGFSLAFDIRTGQGGKVNAFLDWAASERVTVIRVFSTAVNLFDLDPASGRLGIAEVLERAKERGIYIEVVGLADTKQRTFNHQEHIHALGQLCQSYVNCLLEIANEPNHGTQLDIVKEVSYLRGLKALVADEVLVTLGASHGNDDENPIYVTDSDYAVVHSERKGGWDSVRHVREMQFQRDNVPGSNKPFTNDEPDRNLATDQHSGMGMLTRLFSLGDTVHLLPLMYGNIPTGNDLAYFQARRNGWEAFPTDFVGYYYNPSTIGGGPIRRFDPSQIVRIYGALNGGVGYLVGLGVQSEGSIEWQWPTHDRLVEIGQARQWYVSTTTGR